jgi:hypothetical protein
MAKRARKRKCPCCGVFFTPDYRNQRRQRYCCSKPECRKASRAASQKRWLNKPDNRDYFRGPHNVDRVQEWRKAHPGYYREKREALQDLLSGKTLKNPEVKPTFTQIQTSFACALQDILTAQPTVLIGLISHLTGSALQDDIASTARRLQKLGSDILNGPIQNTGGIYDQKASHLPPAHAPDTQPVQLGGSPPGP